MTALEKVAFQLSKFQGAQLLTAFRIIYTQHLNRINSGSIQE